MLRRLWGAAVVGGRHYKEGDAYFKVKEVMPIKFQNFVVLSF